MNVVRRFATYVAAGARSLGAGALAIGTAFVSSCSTTAPPAAGLQLLISTDLSTPGEFGVMRLQISQRMDGGVWNPLWNKDYLVPSEARLPATFAIAAGSAPDQEALIKVTALNVTAPVVVREALVQVPKDRVAELRLVLALACSGKFACPAGQSCQPDTGMCGSSVIDPAKLPTYAAGDSDARITSPGLDAGSDDSGMLDATADDEPLAPAAAAEAGAPDVACPTGTEVCDAACPGDSGTACACAAPCRVSDAADANEERLTSAPGGCIATGPEICNNGIDDDCNGLIDCADRASCGAYACGDKVPIGWVGPALLWTGPPAAAQLPSCPAGYQAFDAFEGLTYRNDQCTCSCILTGQQCSPTAAVYIDQACGTSCASVTLAGTGSCTALPTNNCGLVGTFAVAREPMPGGTCTAQVTATGGGAPSWTSTVRLCTWIGATDSPGGCTTVGAQCLVDPAPFGPLCVTHSGAMGSCPSGYNGGPPIVVYSGTADQRGCTACTCGRPVGGSCTGTVSFYGDTACTGSPTQPTQTCTAFALGSRPGSVRATYTLAPSSCTASVASLPTGSVVPTGATTVCCH